MRARSIVASTFLLLIGCRESAEARAGASTSGATPPSPVATVQPSTPPPPPSTPLQKTIEEASFRLDFEAPTSAKVGEPFPIVVKLTALSGYKVNQEYPIKFAMQGTHASLNPDVLKKEQLTLEAKTAALKGLATATESGEVTIQGKLSFSVCTEERCLIEKRELMVKVSAT